MPRSIWSLQPGERRRLRRRRRAGPCGARRAARGRGQARHRYLLRHDRVRSPIAGWKTCRRPRRSSGRRARPTTRARCSTRPSRAGDAAQAHRRTRVLGAGARDQRAHAAQRRRLLREARRDRGPVQAVHAPDAAGRRAPARRPGSARQGRRHAGRDQLVHAVARRPLRRLHAVARRLRGSDDARDRRRDAQAPDRADRPRALQRRELDARRQRHLLLPPARARHGRAGDGEVQGPVRVLPSP